MRDRRILLWMVACLAACGDSNTSDEPVTGVAGGTGGSPASAGTPAAAAGSQAAGNLASAGAPAPDTAGGSSPAGSGAAAGARSPSGNAGRGSRGGAGGSGGSSRSPASSSAGVGGLGTSGTGTSGTAAVSGSGGAAGDAMCPQHGAITYKLTRSMSPTAAEQMAYAKITEAMDKALMIYNCYTNFTWTVNVQYVSSVQTADGNTNGSIRFGSTDSMNYITAMHETSHTLGVGGAKYKTLIVDGIFTGAEATRALREVTGDPAAELHGDQQHFWPYGLNYTSEVKGMEDLIRHCRIVTAMRKDLGL